MHTLVIVIDHKGPTEEGTNCLMKGASLEEKVCKGRFPQEMGWPNPPLHKGDTVIRLGIPPKQRTCFLLIFHQILRLRELIYTIKISIKYYRFNPIQYIWEKTHHVYTSIL